MTTEGLFLGAAIDAATGDRSDTLIDYDPADLTTHGVIVGMTGSGKTGLGIIFLEEALLAGIPTLIIDPKGDMTNLLLTFPDLQPGDFEPWVDPGEARKENKTEAELGADKAALWSKGLDSWGLSGDTIGQLKNGAGYTVYTPGSQAGVPLNILGSLNKPDLSWDDDAETLRDEIQGFTSGLLGLLGIDADPLSSREHILIANLIEHAWREGGNLDLATLLGSIQRPPIRKLGVFEIDSFYPESDRMKLVMQLNGLLASPAFAEWMNGVPLDIGSMLWDTEGKPQASILYLAHLSDEERQFIVTLILSKVVTWMRSQPGTGDLRALVYMDEVFGFVPPTANPPAKKPILTMLKQARAFGVGMLLSTQNPVDLDYKAMSNAGTWAVGRLQTERDKARILEALQSARGDSDGKTLDAAISGLDKRQFLLHNTHGSEPTIFTTRWALSYLAGPLTRQQVERLQTEIPDVPASTDAPKTEAATEADSAAAAQPDAGGPTIGENETPVMPAVAEGIDATHTDTAAPWLSAIDAKAGGIYEAHVAVRVNLTYDDQYAQLNHTEEWECVVPVRDGFDADNAIAVDYDDRDFLSEAPEQVVYRIPDAKIDTKTFFSKAKTQLKEHLYRNSKVTIQKNKGLKLYSRIDEAPEEFFLRCDEAAQNMADEEAAKITDRYRKKINTAQDQFDAAERRVADLEVDVSSSKSNELLQGAGALLGMLTGRRSTRSITGSASRRGATRSKEQRLQSAKEKSMAEWDDIAELESELQLELEDINDKWETIGSEIEDLEIGLEKTDIDVEDVQLVWIPTA